MTQGEERTIRGLIKMLSAESRSTDEIKEVLKSRPLDIWLTSWVIPALELLVKENRTKYDVELAADLVN